MRILHVLQQAIVMGLLVTSVTGCVPVLVAAGVGAVGGYAVSRDTFEGITSKGQDEIWDASQKVISIMGSIDDNDRKNGEIHGIVNGATITLSIVPINLTTTKIRIKARKGIFPRVGIAQEVYSKIINQLE